MKLYIRFGYMAKFMKLRENNEFLLKETEYIDGNVYYIKNSEKRKDVEWWLKKNLIKYGIEDA